MEKPVKEPEHGEIFERTIVYVNSESDTVRHIEKVRYRGHGFENGIKIYYFARKWDVNGIPETQEISFSEHDFPITNNLNITEDNKVSLITYKTTGIITCEGWI